MLESKLQIIVDRLAMLNPAFEKKAFVMNEQSEFRGITDDYDLYLYARFVEMDGDRLYELRPYSETSKSMYRAYFQFKLVISIKCCNKDLLPIIGQQLSGMKGVKLMAVGDNSESIYKEETGKDLKREDVWLYTLYAECETLYKPEPCYDNQCIDLAACGC